jgi:hypothetical protein
MGTIAAQHLPQTGPRVGSSSGCSHAAHAGARSTDNNASAKPAPVIPGTRAPLALEAPLAPLALLSLFAHLGPLGIPP